METVKAGRSEPWYMLDNAEACLGVLRDVEHRLAQEEVASPTHGGSPERLSLAGQYPRAAELY